MQRQRSPRHPDPDRDRGVTCSPFAEDPSGGRPQERSERQCRQPVPRPVTQATRAAQPRLERPLRSPALRHRLRADSEAERALGHVADVAGEHLPAHRVAARRTRPQGDEHLAPGHMRGLARSWPRGRHGDSRVPGDHVLVVYECDRMGCCGELRSPMRRGVTKVRVRRLTTGEPAAARVRSPRSRSARRPRTCRGAQRHDAAATGIAISASANPVSGISASGITDDTTTTHAN